MGPTHLAIHWVPRALSLEVKWLEHEAEHSPPSTAEVGNCGPIPPTPHLHGVVLN
jgi:hypothetical protein